MADVAAETEPPARVGEPGGRARVAAWGASAGVVVLGVVWLALMGRVWWCACRTPAVFIADPATAHNSQHVFDWYSFSHLLHGVILFLVLRWAAPGLGVSWKLLIAVVVETAWEVVENSPMVIERYRTATAAIGYEGDSIVNAVGDILFMVAGFFLARAIGWKASVVLFVVIEVGMLIAIRDNLSLNVLMLLWPVEAVRAWQSGVLG